MDELTLTTPTLLFSAVSLILLAYTNRFLSYAQLVRTLKEQYVKEHSEVTAAQIANLRKRLYLTRNMQVLGISSLFFCVITMFLIYIGLHALSVYIFGFALLLLIACWDFPSGKSISRSRPWKSIYRTWRDSILGIRLLHITLKRMLRNLLMKLNPIKNIIRNITTT